VGTFVEETMTTQRTIVMLTVLAGTAALGGGAATPASAEQFKVDRVHSSVVFRVKHMGVSYFYGRFNDVSGSFAFDDADESKCSFDVEVKTESVDTASDKRDNHLKSPDFFNARQYPSIRFKSTAVKKTADNTYEVTGELTLLGQTKPLTVTVERVGVGKGQRGGSLCGIETIFTIKRSEFGMTYGLEGVSDEVRLMVSLEGGSE